MPFNIGPGELIVILIIALVVLGPGKLPDVASSLGKSVREFRKAATDVTEAGKLDGSVSASPSSPSTSPSAAVTPASTAAVDAPAPAPAPAAPPPPPVAETPADEDPATTAGAVTPARDSSSS